MADYTPPFTITNTMLDCAASISEKIGKMSALKNLEAKPHLRKNNRIRSIYSSLRIEANSLSIGQVRDTMQVADAATASRAPENTPAMVKKIGKTTYKVHVHFSNTSTETMSDKIKRMLKNEIQQM